MNEAWNSFLQTVFQFVKSLFVSVSKTMHRNAAVLTAGAAVVTVLAFASGDFGGGGRNALVAFAETQQGKDEEEAETEETTDDSDFQNMETEMSEEREEESEDKVAARAFRGPGYETAESAENTEDSQNGAEDLENTTKASESDTEETAQTGTEKAAEDAAGGLEAVGEEEAAELAGGTDTRMYACSEKDYNVLLRIVQAEAGNCDAKGKILVANVILNRVESEEFPDTISGVVYERSQFSPVSNGTINSCRVTQETVEAVDRALAGEDYSEGALYFMNRRSASSRNVRWFDTHLDYLFKHGSHEFFK